MAGAAVARCKIRDIYCSRFAFRIRNSGQFNGEEFPCVDETALAAYNAALQDDFILIFMSKMPEFLNILMIPARLNAMSKILSI